MFTLPFQLVHGGSSQTIFVHNISYMDRTSSSISLSQSHVWTAKDPVHDLKEVFASQDDLLGARVAITTLVWPPFVLGDEVDGGDPAHLWDNFWGFEVGHMLFRAEIE